MGEYGMTDPKHPESFINRRQVYHKMNPTSQTKSKMDNELQFYVLNQGIPDTPHNYREVWFDTHPGEPLTSSDLIHHINGNHNDNRPENLLKLVSCSEHRLKHMELNKNLNERPELGNNVSIAHECRGDL
jgi:hypothetical protein